MKVKAKPSAPSVVGWLDTNECLTVLALSVTPVEGVKYLIWSTSQEAVALFPSGEFDVVNGCLSSRWVFSSDSEGYSFFAPKAWQVSGFWERYHEGGVLEEQAFEKERNLILKEV